MISRLRQNARKSKHQSFIKINLIKLLFSLNFTFTELKLIKTIFSNPNLKKRKKMNIKDHVREMSEFQYYKDGQLWYKTEDTQFEFPVPIDDIGNASFRKFEKSLILMRYIRKWMKVLEDKQN